MVVRLPFRRGFASAANKLQGSCVNPSKLRGNAKPYDTLFGMMGSTPVLRMAPLLSRMPAFQGRDVPEIMVKLECVAPPAPPHPIPRGTALARATLFFGVPNRFSCDAALDPLHGNRH